MWWGLEGNGSLENEWRGIALLCEHCGAGGGRGKASLLCTSELPSLAGLGLYVPYWQNTDTWTLTSSPPSLNPCCVTHTSGCWGQYRG